MYDLIIIGMGPAGMNAALYAKRSGMKVLLIEKNIPGGLINITNKVENYLGVGIVTGAELVDKMVNHIKEFNIEQKREEVISIEDLIDKKVIKTNKSIYETKAVLIASGRMPKKGEGDIFSKLEGRGVSYCAVCDAPFYKNKVVGIIGGGNSAFEEGLYLSDFASKVYFIIRSNIKADKIFIDETNKKENVEILLNSTVTDIKTKNDLLSGVIINETEELNLDGLFLYIGYKPNTNYIENLGLTDEKGYIIVDENMETKIKGIYAAGDIVKKNVYQIINAASEGAIAAINSKKYSKD